MELKRFFIDKKDIIDNKVIIKGAEYERLFKVLRYKKGFKLIACADDGRDIYCTIIELYKDYAECVIDKTERNNNETRKNITLYIACPKSDKMDIIVQKAIELGVKKIIPVYTQYSCQDIRLDRLNKISIDASKQCGRAYCVEIDKPIEFKELIEHKNLYDSVLMGYEHERKISFKNIDKSLFLGNNIAVIVGSEGGFSVDEADFLKKSGIVAFSLGNRILRTETAAITILSLVMYECGELNINEELI